MIFVITKLIEEIVNKKHIINDKEVKQSPPKPENIPQR
jgi:hypothetical protein